MPLEIISELPTKKQSHFIHTKGNITKQSIPIIQYQNTEWYNNTDVGV